MPMGPRIIVAICCAPRVTATIQGGRRRKSETESHAVLPKKKGALRPLSP